MQESIFYVGTLEAEERARRERELGYDANYLDSGVDPSDYSDGQINGLSVLVYDLADSSSSYILGLAAALHRAGAASILIFDCDGRYMFRKAPFNGDLLAYEDLRACA